MTTPQPTALQGQHKHACSLCAKRKIKCDKAEPCSNCTKAQAQCLYEGPAPPRPRKRAADEELLARLAAYEDLMRKHNVDFTPCSHGWITSGPQGRIKQDKSEAISSATSPLDHQSSSTQLLKGISMATERSVLERSRIRRHLLIGYSQLSLVNSPDRGKSPRAVEQTARI